jgi:hypothetical protein
LIKVKDERGLVRDPNSKAILRTDSSALLEHRRKRQMQAKLHADAAKVSSLEDRVEQQSLELAELRGLINQLLAQNK